MSKIIYFFIKFLKIFFVFFFVLFLSRYIMKVLRRSFLSNIKDKALLNFVISIFRYLLVIILFIFILEIININTSPLLTILGTITLTIGISLRNSLSNLSSGILLIVLEFFKIDDYIEFDNIIGKVCDIQLFATIVKTDEGKVIIVPNNKLLSNNIINLSLERIIFPIRFSLEKNNKNIFVYKNIIEDIIIKEFSCGDINVELKNIFLNNFTSINFEVLILVQTDVFNQKLVKSIILEKIIERFV